MWVSIMALEAYIENPQFDLDSVSINFKRCDFVAHVVMVLLTCVEMIRVHKSNDLDAPSIMNLLHNILIL